MDTLRFITCGSVDDGKSTLIGRLLYETKMLYNDQLETLLTDSKKFGTQQGRLDFALLTDGLQAEREQGITIDVAYRHFSTSKRRFIVADTPGHEQYTRNMATGASTAHAAVLLLDARKGMLVQTRRHSRICAMLGVPHVAVAINKMDLVDWDQNTFQRIERDCLAFAEQLGFTSISAIPLSALEGQNVFLRADDVSWYNGPSLLEWLESVPADTGISDQPFKMPVQWVNRPNLDFRGFAGRIASGTVKPGDHLRISPSGVTTTVKSVIVGFKEQSKAAADDSVTLVLADEVDASRGDVMASSSEPVEVADQFEAEVLWMHDHALLPGRPYSAMIHTKAAGLTVTDIKYKFDPNTGAHLAAKNLALNEIATVAISFDRPVPFTSYKANKRLGSFIIIDRVTNDTVGAGMIHYALRRAANVHWQALEVNKQARSTIKHQKPRCLWFTGLSGSGKSTIANFLERRLNAEGFHTFILDGDNIRHGLNRDLGFTEEDRVENIRRVAEVAKLMVEAGLIVIVSFISPYRAERELARSLFSGDEFIEVYVDTPLAVCEERDPKGLYAKARRGELKNFTGIDSSYEPPTSPEVTVHPAAMQPEQAVNIILERL